MPRPRAPPSVGSDLGPETRLASSWPDRTRPMGRGLFDFGVHVVPTWKMGVSMRITSPSTKPRKSRKRSVFSFVSREQEVPERCLHRKRNYKNVIFYFQTAINLRSKMANVWELSKRNPFNNPFQPKLESSSTRKLACASANTPGEGEDISVLRTSCR